MNKSKERAKRGIKELDRCILCNNKAQYKCKSCKSKICNDCREESNKCYKCNASETIITVSNNTGVLN